MMKILYFMVAWMAGLVALNYFTFNTMFKFIRDENAVAILCVMIVSVFTVVLGIVVGRRK